MWRFVFEYLGRFLPGFLPGFLPAWLVWRRPPDDDEDDTDTDTDNRDDDDQSHSDADNPDDDDDQNHSDGDSVASEDRPVFNPHLPRGQKRPLILRDPNCHYHGVEATKPTEEEIRYMRAIHQDRLKDDARRAEENKRKEQRIKEREERQRQEQRNEQKHDGQQKRDGQQKHDGQQKREDQQRNEQQRDDQQLQDQQRQVQQHEGQQRDDQQLDQQQLQTEQPTLASLTGPQLQAATPPELNALIEHMEDIESRFPAELCNPSRATLLESVAQLKEVSIGLRDNTIPRDADTNRRIESIGDTVASITGRVHSNGNNGPPPPRPPRSDDDGRFQTPAFLDYVYQELGRLGSETQMDYLAFRETELRANEGREGIALNDLMRPPQRVNPGGPGMSKKEKREEKKARQKEEKKERKKEAQEKKQAQEKKLAEQKRAL